ncbi:subtilisin-like protein [Daedalea quercina L-15889]|uniref:tripeptidyl-peptidase II n=1 Tax=Daedalea quercina L-15889 TaxID=1314783 RepID=A0A165SDI3_9APHY|nr:subtilisin-like protein [Daedalea quercina L-15889]
MVSRLFAVHESRPNVPKGFSLTGPAAPDTTLNLRLALVRGNTVGLIDALYDVSTPSSAHYGQHLTKEEAEAFVAPKQETASAVNAWLNENNLQATALTPTGDWLAVSVSVSQANELFGTNFSVYTHTATGKDTIRTLSYSIPTDLVGHLDLVHPTITFPDPFGTKPVAKSLPQTRASKRADDCLIGGENMTPSCLQSLYGIPTTPATSPSNMLGVTGYVEQWAEYSDLTSFLQQYRPDMNSSTSFTVVSVDNGTNPQNGEAGQEASLDTQYTVGIATDVPVTFITVGGEAATGDELANVFIDTAAYLLNQSAPPQVVTTSYGIDEDTVSQNLAYNLCDMYAQLGARGISMLFASGDGGVSGGYSDPSCTTFLPTFPSGCPYVTSVGGTINIPEQAVNLSAGGFSNYWPTADFQTDAVSSYLATIGDQNSGLYNASGRGYPDVSVYAVNFEVVLEGMSWSLSGTSCSAPTFASIVALLNDRLLAAGKSTLGWLNPLLYSDASSAFNDITEGNNYACSDFTTGFDAATGWDPVTGWGTPDFTSLLTAIGL